MTAASRRRWRLPALLAAGAVVLTACGVDTGRIAARVGDEVITTDELAQITDESLQEPELVQNVSGRRADYQRTLLNYLIELEFISQLAEQRGITVSQQELDDAYAQQVERAAAGDEALFRTQLLQQSNLTPAMFRRLLPILVIREKLGEGQVEVTEDELREAYEADSESYDRVNVRYLVVETSEQAQELLTEVREDPDRLPDLAREFSLDPNAAETGGETGFQPRSYYRDLADQVWDADEGDVFLVETADGAFIIHKLEHRTVSFDEARPGLELELTAQRAREASDAIIAEARQGLSVTVNPRFGAWSEGEVIPPLSDVVGRGDEGLGVEPEGEHADEHADEHVDDAS